MLEVKPFQFNMFGVKTYIVYDPLSREAAIVDPGMVSDADHKMLNDFIEDNTLKVKYILQTHLHLDHCFGTAALAGKLSITPMAHPDDFFLAQTMAEQLQMFGLPQNLASIPGPFSPLHQGDRLTLGKDTIEVIHMPGHSPGGLAFHAPQSHWVLTGDSLFDGSIGRTDLPGGSYPTLIQSIQQNLLTLPHGTRAYPGHGPAFTINQSQP